MNQLETARAARAGAPPPKGEAEKNRPKTAAEINDAMSRADIDPAEAAELKARDDEVVQANRRGGGKPPLELKSDDGKKNLPPKRGDAVASEQGTMNLARPSPTALKIIRAILAASDVGKKVRAFEKKLYANLDKQMEVDKVDYLEVDGVPFRREKKSKVKMGAFSDWRPATDSTTALLQLLGVTADDFKAASETETPQE